LKKITFILGFFLLISCSQSNEEKLALLNGYWEIASVTTSEGVIKEFSISQNVDFIDIENGKGIRKKVQPDLMGNFKTSNASENIDVEIDNDRLILKYSTAFDTWNETVLEVTKEKLRVENDNGNTYTYRRYEPLMITN
jgi:hypothetical protein